MSEIRTTATFGAVALALLLVTWATAPRLTSPAVFAERGELLFPQFRDPNAAASLEVTQFDARNAILAIPAGKSPTIAVSAIQLAAKNPVGTPIGITYRVYLAGKLIAVDQPPNPPLRFDGWITLPLKFTPAKGKSYVVTVDMNAPSGDTLSHTLTLNAT